MDKNLNLAGRAQVQAMGNLNAVIFRTAGGDKDYSVRIGTDDFSFSGLFYHGAPITGPSLTRWEIYVRRRRWRSSPDTSVTKSGHTLFDTY